MTADDIRVNNGKRLLTLDELAQTQPGMDRLMNEIADRAWRLYHAARAGNWPLAGYFCRTLGKQLRMSAFVRPKYADAMATFLDDDYQPVRDAIAAEDTEAFERAWRALVDRVNHWHGEFGKGYIVWRTPEQPPHDLDLAPRG